MEKAVHQLRIERARASVGDFGPLLAELNRAEAIAPVEHGLQQLVNAIDVLRRRTAATRH